MFNIMFQLDLLLLANFVRMAEWASSLVSAGL
jgi:hypothetical protein